MTIALILSVALKSTLIALGGLLLAHHLRRHAARSRVFVLRLTLLALAACVATAAAPPLIGVAWPAPPLAKASTQPDVQATIAMPLTPALDGVLTARWSPPSPAFLATLLLYGLGVAATGAPLIAGLCLLTRWSREATPLTRGRWMETLQQLAPLTRTRLATSAAIQSPLSWGAAPSWILIDPVTLGRPDCAPSVLAHELAHTRAGDWAFHMLSGALRALFWFNPLVWRLHAALVDAAEEAADDAAIQIVGRKRLAGTLLNLGGNFGRTPSAGLALVGAGSGLKARIQRLAAPPIAPSKSGFRRAVGSLAVLAASVLSIGPAAHGPLETVLETPLIGPTSDRLRPGRQVVDIVRTVSPGADDHALRAPEPFVDPSPATAAVDARSFAPLDHAAPKSSLDDPAALEQAERTRIDADRAWEKASVAWASADRAQGAADRDHAAAAIAWALAETRRLDASQSHLAARGASFEAEASRAAVAANRAATANL